MESLFTNVPVRETIDIIISNVYNHSNLPKPKMDENLLRDLLEICTTRTPFKHVNGDLYVQCEGVSMGSCLGPTFSEYYMCYLENKVFEKYPSLKPRLYTRYVDNIFVVIDDLSGNRRHQRKVSRIICIAAYTYTHEPEKDHKLAFLDCLFEHFGESYQTSVYIKETNVGDCLNFKSICLENYKI